MNEGPGSLKATGLSFFRPFHPLVRGWCYSALGWAAFFFVIGLQIASVVPAGASEVLRMVFVPWLAWSFLTPLLFRAVDRHPVESLRSRALLFHILAALAVTSVLQTLRPPSKHRQNETRTTRPVRPLLGPDIFIYFAIVGVAHAFSFYRRSKERELHAVELTASLAEARLQALRMQLQPHFLFNSLNAIAALIHEDPERAEEMIEALAEFLRLTLRESQGAETPLRREIELVRRYLEIEKIRFGDRLRFDIDAPESTLDLPVPVLLLQPLAENAIRHGLEPRVGPGEIHVGARIADKKLLLTVRDDGAGMPENPHFGIGLSNIRERLRELHGDQAALLLESGGGTTVKIELPIRA